MKNILLLVALFILSQVVNAEVITPNDDLLNQDLKFGHQDSQIEDDKRKIASEKGSTAKEESGDRDVASDADEDSNKIQFWEY